MLIVRRFGEPQLIYDRHPAAGYTNESGRSACRLPAGHPEAFFEAFANVYSAAFDDISQRGTPGNEPLYPTVYDGLEGVRFVEQVVASSAAGGQWLGLSSQ